MYDTKINLSENTLFSSLICKRISVRYGVVSFLGLNMISKKGFLKV